MTKPATPAQIQVLLDLYSMHTRLIESTGTANRTYYRVMRNTRSLDAQTVAYSVGVDRLIIDEHEPIEEWAKVLEEYSGQLLP